MKNPWRYVVFFFNFCLYGKSLVLLEKCPFDELKGRRWWMAVQIICSSGKKTRWRIFFFVLLKMLLLLEAIRRNRYLILANTKSRSILYITFWRMQKTIYFFLKNKNKKPIFIFFHFNFRHYINVLREWMLFVCTPHHYENPFHGWFCECLSLHHLSRF